MTTFKELQDYSRARANIQNNQSIDQKTLAMYLNMSLGSLYNIIATDYEDYNMVKYLCTLNANTGNQIPVPPDFFKLRAVDFGGPGFWTTVFSFMLEERNRMNNPIANMITPYGNMAARKVRVMNNSIFVEPEMLCTGQYQIWYSPKYHFLKLPTDTLIPAMDTNAWVEYAICSTGEKIYTQLNLPTAAFTEQKMYYEQLVRNGAQSRNDSDAPHMINSRNVTDWNFGGNGGGNGGWV